jgi:hypothetical protein
VSAEIEKYCALLEQRVLLLRALAEQLVGCRAEFMAMDLDGMYGRIAAQEDLCRRIQKLGAAIGALERVCAKQSDLGRLLASGLPEDAAIVERLRGARRDLQETRAEVGRLNHIHAAYLRRSCRTVNMLANFCRSYALTYTPPARSSFVAARIGENR